MPPSHRSPTRGSVGNGGDPRLPGSTSGPHAAGPGDSDDFTDYEDPEAPWGEDEDEEYAAPLGERIDLVRRKYMPLPDEVVYEFLGEDEYVVHSDHPSFRAFLTQNMMFVVLIPIVGPMFIFFMQGGITREAVMVFLILDIVVAILALKRLGDRYTSYVITNLRLIKISGIISRKLASIPWTRMTGLGYEQKALGRVLGYATIFIESANEESGLRNFSDVNDPQTFHQRLLDMVSAKSGQTGRQPPPPTTGQRRSVFQKRKDRKRAAREAEADRRERMRRGPGGPPPARTGQPPPGGRPRRPGGAETPGPERRSPTSHEKVGPDEATPPEGTPRVPEPTPPTGSPRVPPQEAEPEPGEPLRARPKAPGRRPAPDHDAAYSDEAYGDADYRDKEPAARAPRQPPPADQDEDDDQPRGKWSWWPGTSAGKAPPGAAPQPEEAGAGPPPKKRRRQPDQRAPSRRPPETIIVPESGKGQRRPPPRKPGRRPGRFREIDGWQE